MNWRRSELLSAATLLTVAGWIWYASSKNTEWDQTQTDLTELKPRVASVEKREDELEARSQAQMTYIIKELDSINRKVGRD